MPTPSLPCGSSTTPSRDERCRRDRCRTCRLHRLRSCHEAEQRDGLDREDGVTGERRQRGGQQQGR